MYSSVYFNRSKSTIHVWEYIDGVKHLVFYHGTDVNHVESINFELKYLTVIKPVNEFIRSIDSSVYKFTIVMGVNSKSGGYYAMGIGKFNI